MSLIRILCFDHYLCKILSENFILDMDFCCSVIDCSLIHVIVIFGSTCINSSGLATLL